MSDWPAHLTIRPIQEWPGPMTPAVSRTRSAFSASWRSILDLLDRELDHLYAERPVLQIAIEERDLRIDGYPRASAQPKHPGVILSMETPHGALSYPCDSFLDWRDNVRAIALSLEALRKIDHYGVTRRGEQYKGWRAISAEPYAPVMETKEHAAAYILGLCGVELTPSMQSQVINDLDVRRKLVAGARRTAHPDMHSGSTQSFQLLQEAIRKLEED